MRYDFSYFDVVVDRRFRHPFLVYGVYVRLVWWNWWNWFHRVCGGFESRLTCDSILATLATNKTDLGFVVGVCLYIRIFVYII